MIQEDRDGGVFDVTCDYCTNYIEVNSDPGWQAMLTKIKIKGWWIRKVGDEWKHMCPFCRKNGKQFK